MTLGDRLKEARKQKNMTQMDASKRLGITNGALSGYERNYRDPDTEMLKKIADLYNVSSEWLLGRSDEMEKKLNSPFNSKDEKDVAKRLEKFREDIEKSDGLAFSGEPMSEEAKESLIESMKFIFEQTQRINKKYTPKKYRDKN